MMTARQNRVQDGTARRSRPGRGAAGPRHEPGGPNGPRTVPSRRRRAPGGGAARPKPNTRPSPDRSGPNSDRQHQPVRKTGLREIRTRIQAENTPGYRTSNRHHPTTTPTTTHSHQPGRPEPARQTPLAPGPQVQTTRQEGPEHAPPRQQVTPCDPSPGRASRGAPVPPATDRFRRKLSDDGRGGSPIRRRPGAEVDASERRLRRRPRTRMAGPGCRRASTVVVCHCQ